MYIYVCSVCLHASMYAYIYLLRFKNTFLLFLKMKFSSGCCWHSGVHTSKMLPERSWGYE